MRHLLAGLLFVFAPAGAQEAPAAAQFKPFRAQYATLRNGSDIGRTTLELRDNGDGSWTLQSETRGTSGLARLAGVHVVETSRFRWQGGHPEALDYDYRQESAFRDRTRHASFDWAKGSVEVRQGEQTFHYAIVPGIIDRQSVTLALASDLMHGATTFQYAVAVKSEVETMRYRRGAVESVQVPAGRFQAQLMLREGEPGADRKRVSRSWFAASLGYLPVRIEQSEKNGDTIVLELLELH